MKRSSFITWDQLKVGALILLALGVIGVAVYKLGKSANLFAKRYELIAFLKEAPSLRVGGQVLVAGQLAGTIRDIRFLPVDADTMRNLRIVLAIDEKLHDQIRRDSRVHVKTLGLLGDKVVDISPGTPKASVLQNGDTIQVEPTLDYEEVLAKAAGAVDDLVNLTHDLNQMTSSLVAGKGTMGQLLTNPALYNQLEGTLARTNEILARVQSSKGTLSRILDDPSLYDHMVSAVAGVDSLLGAARSKNGTMGRLLTDTTLYAQGTAMMQTFSSIAQNADSLMKSIKAGHGLIGRAMTDDALYDSLSKLVHDFTDLLADIKKDPSRYTKGLIKVF